MKKDFVPYKEALALRELGFNEPCITWYFDTRVDIKLYPESQPGSGLSLKGCKNSHKKIGITDCTAPLYSQAFRWFREKHKWSSYIKSIEYIGHNGVKQVWEVNLKYLPTNSEHKGMVYETYEEAELSCLIKLIEIVKDDE